MRFNILFCFLLTCAFTGRTQVTYNELPAKSFVLLTSGSHDSWAEWSPDNRTIVSLSYTGQEVINLFSFHLDSMRFRQHEKIYVADYNSENTYHPITFFSTGYIDSPVFSEDGKHIAFRKDLDYILQLHMSTGKTDTLLHRRAHAFDYLHNDVLVFTSEEDTVCRIFELDTKNGRTRVLYEHPVKPLSLVVQGTEVFLTYRDSVCIFNAHDFSFKESFPVEFIGTRISRLDENTFILTVPTLNGPASALYNYSTRRKKLFMNGYDYEPTLSYDKKAVTFISEGAMGIVLLKLE